MDFTVWGPCAFISSEIRFIVSSKLQRYIEVNQFNLIPTARTLSKVDARGGIRFALSYSIIRSLLQSLSLPLSLIWLQLFPNRNIRNNKTMITQPLPIVEV